MALTATFKADFSSFVAESDKARAALKGVADEATKVNASVDAIKPPENLTKLGDAADKAGEKSRTLKQSYRDFNDLLKVGGVNINDQIGALDNLTNAIGKSSSELGLFAKAGLVVGAAMAGWQFGRAISGWLGLDQAIGNATASLLGYQAAQDAQVKGAHDDELARASNNAKRAITDLAEARRINAQAAKDNIITLDTEANRIALWNGELDKVRKAGHFEQLNAELKSQNFEVSELALKYDVSAKALNYLARQNKDAADAAREENDAVKTLQGTWKETADIMADFATKTHGIAMKAMQEERAERAKLLKETNDTVITGLESIKAAQADYADWVLKNSLNEHDYKVAKINAWADATINAFKGTQEQAGIYAAFIRDSAMQQIKDLDKTTEKVAEVGDEYAQMYKQATEGVLVIGKGVGELAETQKKSAKETGDAVTDEYRRQAEAFMSFKGVVVAGTGQMSAALTAVPTLWGSTDPSDVLMRNFLMQQAQRERGEFFMTGMGGPRLGVATRASGGPVSAGRPYLVGEQGPELFSPSSNGFITPSGGGTVVNNTFYVNGSIRDLAAPLMDELSRMMKQTRLWPSAT